ncbi:hypothetical protein [Streptomyces sp. NPDC089919]|uniref:hypothetical protein n=1 Tax=Streptomyces sp. NPDC089919 TaxID=3155188 RepID=UPI003443D118
MLHFIALLMTPLLRLCLPPTGRHRAGRLNSTRLHRHRRRVLVLATYGVDLGPRFIHGREAAR